MIQKNCVNSCLVSAFEALINCAGTCDCNNIDGCITLNQGNHEITVATDSAPTAVFLSVSPIGTPVCSGNIDMVGYSLLPTGFVLYANIMSNSAEVCYIVE
jgi:hypothetical protein